MIRKTYWKAESNSVRETRKINLKEKFLNLELNINTKVIIRLIMKEGIILNN